MTEKLYLFATSHVPVVHPIAAAKMATTIDHISKGRFGLNMVCGWFQPEMEMFGAKMMEHDTGYAYASEWVEIVLKLWTEQWFDYKGEFLTINQGFAEPKPYQKPRPVLICAGSSPKGRDFAAKYCDINFSVVENIEKGTAWVKHIKELAWSNYRREIGTPEQVTAQLLQLSATGIDGTLVSMVDYNQELPYWNERMMPLLEQAGLRKPHAQARMVA
jgi:FMNH2-dependent dimethyl sulfone monooxygenase